MLNVKEETEVLVFGASCTVEYKVIVEPLMTVMLIFTTMTSIMMLFTNIETVASHVGTPVG